jgi:hypothetical protein
MEDVDMWATWSGNFTWSEKVSQPRVSPLWKGLKIELTFGRLARPPVGANAAEAHP